MDYTLSEQIKLKGLELGFSHVGIIPCEDFEDYASEVELRPGYEKFLANPESFYAGCFPSRFFPQGKSIICATIGFSDIDFPEKLTPYIGRAYLARCYVPLPEIMAGRRLEAMREFLEERGMEVYRGKVETPARVACARAGIVTYGRNNFAYTEEDGSFIIMYTWLVDAELEYEVHEVQNGCPSDCLLCMKACPTAAIEESCRVNPKKCILMNNLNVSGMLASPDQMGLHLHGCDVCQEVCPRNHAVLEKPKCKDPFLEEIAERFDLVEMLLLDSFADDYYQCVLRPVMYNYIRDVDMFRRNAAVAMGNSGDERFIPALREATRRFADLPSGQAAACALEKLEKLAARR